ncbi:MAG: alpha/beta hydrolase [Planctomycetes bacterium]|nr:alpha/beta hydrolase [Planctomycetota bacterium]
MALAGAMAILLTAGEPTLDRNAAERLRAGLMQVRPGAIWAEGVTGECVVQAAGMRMRCWYRAFGPPVPGRPLFISMHGGGSAPAEVNDQQWRNQQRLYAPAHGVYVAPRAPTDSWNMWHQDHVTPLLDALIASMVREQAIDPDRVYLMGYSAGGDGVYQLATRMADRFAAAAMMAGHPNETRPDGLRNLPFTLHMGDRDAAFDRNRIAREWGERLDAMAGEDPGGYPHRVVIHPDKGHWMDREDAVAVPWMATHRRNLRPDRVVWLQDDALERRFYWLVNPDPGVGQRVVVRRQGQDIHVEEAKGVRRLGFLLDDGMLDLDRPIRVTMDGSMIFQGVVPRSDRVMRRTLLERGDPSAVFTAEIEVDLPDAPR